MGTIVSVPIIDHATIIGLPPSDRKLVYDTWNKGRIDIKPIQNGAVRYVCGYLFDEVKCPDNLYEYWGDFQPQFPLFSKGLGTEHYRKYSDKYNDFGEFALTGNGDKVFSLNPYYKKKYGFRSRPFFDKEIMERAKNNSVHYFQQLQKENYLAEERYIHQQRAKGKSVHDTLINIPEY